ncbi:MAG: hypothetical protein R3F23_03670 [Verrucomicrobiia bacterium]
MGRTFGHGIRAELMPGILKYLNKSALRISSVHNYCPLPPGMQKDAPDFLTYTPTPSSRSQTRRIKN